MIHVLLWISWGVKMESSWSVVTGRRVESSPPGPSQYESPACLLRGPELTRAHSRDATPRYDLKEMKCHTWGMLGTLCSGGEVTTGRVWCLLSCSCRAFSLRQTRFVGAEEVIHCTALICNPHLWNTCVYLLTSTLLLRQHHFDEEWSSIWAPVTISQINQPIKVEQFLY